MTTRIKHLYIHVPFCRSICYYCDFCHRLYDEKTADRWLERLEEEIKENCHDQYETIYLGGGTPSCLSGGQLERLLKLIRPFSYESMEYTLEANPESLDPEKIMIMKEYGINRISLGVQSADDHLLKALGRKHSFQDVRDRIGLLKNQGITNISVDLMYSLPGQDMQILQDTLDAVLSLEVPHISLYSLLVEENTVFGKKKTEVLDEETEADMYELIEKVLTDHGYIHYEISNYGKEGYESKHNLGYWNYDDFLGLSLGASGKIGNSRYTNTRSFERYLKDKEIREEDLYLSKKEMMFEHIMMSLRTIYGLDIEKFNRTYDCDLIGEYPKGIRNPDIEIRDGKLLCRKPAILNRILLDFMEQI